MRIESDNESPQGLSKLVMKC